MMLSKYTCLDQQLYDYILASSLRESPVLAQLRAETVTLRVDLSLLPLADGLSLLRKR